MTISDNTQVSDIKKTICQFLFIVNSKPRHSQSSRFISAVVCAQDELMAKKIIFNTPKTATAFFWWGSSAYMENISAYKIGIPTPDLQPNSVISFNSPARHQ